MVQIPLPIVTIELSKQKSEIKPKRIQQQN